MNFADWEFWPRLLGVIVAWFAMKFIACGLRLPLPESFDRWALGATSLFLLGSVNALTLAIFLTLAGISIATIYALAAVPLRFRRKLLLVAVPLLFVPLVYYKYRTFLVEEVVGWSAQTFEAIAIPAGISFYTFQMVGILVDASRLPGFRPKVVDLVNFLSFFPQVVAGPIERKSNLLPQLEGFQLRVSLANLNAAAPWLALGFFYKLCLADNLSAFIDPEAMESAWPIVITTVLFGWKIYFDFCGYSLIALGLGRAIGVNLTLNFRTPYFAASINDFWRRWHVSLSYWFRDYVYIPLGGSRTRRWALNLMIVFVVSGFWHGAGFGFLLWGALHGLYCVIGHALGEKLRLPVIIRWSITLILVFVAWLPFYEIRFPVLLEKCRLLTTVSSYGVGGLINWAKGFDPADLLTLVVLVSLCLATFIAEGFSRKRGNDYGFAQSPVVIFVLVLATIWLGSSQGNEFVYFSF